MSPEPPEGQARRMAARFSERVLGELADRTGNELEVIQQLSALASSVPATPTRSTKLTSNGCGWSACSSGGASTSTPSPEPNERTASSRASCGQMYPTGLGPSIPLKEAAEQAGLEPRLVERIWEAAG